MNFKKILLMPMLSLVLTINVCEAQHYFWADNKKHEMEADSSIIVLMKENQEAASDATKIAVDKIERHGDCVILRNTTKSHHKSFRNKRIEFAVAYRVNSVPVIATNVVSFVAKSSIDEIETAFKKHIRFRDKTQSGVYHYSVNNFRETLTIANAIAESGLVEWCQPDFFIEIKSTTIDPLYNQQYYLNNTGQTGGVNNIDINAPEAWAISKGCYSTRVAVIDFGVESHEDLGARYQTGFTALNPAGTGLPASTEYHGQACAGIIAASHDNNLGIAGISPASLIIPVNGVIGVNSVSQVADGIRAGWDARGNADVLSNSWSWASAPSLSEISIEINNARTQGRGGKGAIVVFSAGNGGSSVEFPANVDGVIAVGAINKSGSKWSYSATGSSLDLVAPTGNGSSSGDVYTLDLSDDPANNSDNRGGTNGNYLSTFGGTSAAAPQAAGVAALMLSVNPNLTEAQVRSFLQQSATDMGTAGFDNSYGYGRLNAYEALRLSIGSINGSNLICSSSQYTLTHQLQNVSGVSWHSSNTSALSIDSNTGIATRQNNFNGQVTITATITIPCGTINLPRDIWVGNPSYSGETIVRDINDPNQNVSYVYTYSNAVQFYVSVASSVSNYQWTITSDQSCGSTYNGPKFYSNGNGTQATITNNRINVNTGTCSGTFWIQCKAVNSCGPTYYSQRLFKVTNSSGGGGGGGGGDCEYSLSTYPNPSQTDGDVTINLETPPPECESSIATLNSQETTTSDEISSITLIDSSGDPIYNETCSGTSHVLNTDNLNRGIYYVKVQTIQGRTFQTRIVKK